MMFSSPESFKPLGNYHTVGKKACGFGVKIEKGRDERQCNCNEGNPWNLGVI